MKKIYYILTLVAAAMTISACNNAFEDEGPALNGGEGSDNTITFVVGPETDAVGRTALDLEDGKTTLWKATDNAGLYYSYTLAGTSTTVAVDDVQNVKLKINGEASANAVFVGNDSPVEWWKGEGYEDATHKFYFYYPYKEGTASQSKVEGTLPAEQTYDATASEWDMSKYDFVYATKAEAYGKDVELQIKRAFSVLRLGITNNSGEDVTIEEVSLTSEGGKILAGTFYVNTTKGEMDNALSNRTDAPTKATHGSNTAYGYWTSTNSTITTIVTNGAVKAGEKIDVRFMLNAGYSKSDVSADKFIDTTTPYLEGDTFTVRIKTNKGTHPAVQFTAGALLRGARAGKSITLEAIPAGEPTVTDIESDHSTKTKFYLNNTITIKGSNLQNAANVKIGGVAVEPEVLKEGTELVVKLPDCTGTATTAADYAITYTYEGEEATLRTISIYPFYHYENITLGVGASSKSEYAEFTASNAFFYPDLGEVVSTNKWYDDEMDKFTLGYAEYPSPIKYTKVSSTTYIGFDKTYITEQQYYDVLPYVFFITNSAGKVTLVGPANTASQLKTHLRNGGSGNVNLPSEAGTPLMWYRSMRSSNTTENACREAVLNGTLAEMSYTGSVASAGAPSMAKEGLDLSSQSSLWREGTVLLVQYVSYEAAYNSDSAHGAKPAANSDVAKIGFVHIKNLENVFYATDGNGNTKVDGNNQLIVANPNTGKRDMKITFDMYWSKKLN